MTNYELCKYYLERNEKIMDEWQHSNENNCVDKSIDFLGVIMNTIRNGELNLPASVKFYESYRSINILHMNHVIDRYNFETLSLLLLDQIIKDIQKYIEYKDEQMKEGE